MAHRLRRSAAIFAALLLFAATPALAGDASETGQDATAVPVPDAVTGKPIAAPKEPAAAPSESRWTAADVADAPRPGQAGGIRIDRPGPSKGLWVPRVIFFLPRWALELTMAGPRALLWAYDRVQLAERWKSIFFNEEGTVGVYPVGFVETGFGLNAGARLFHRDLFGHGERLRFRASYGGRYRQFYSAKFTTGELLGESTMLTLEGDFEIYPKSRFSGIGNRDEQHADAIAGLIDASSERTAVLSRFAHDDAGVAAAFESELTDVTRLRLLSAWRWRKFTRGIDVDDDDRPIWEVYDVSRLTGYDSGLSNIYSEAELTVDTRTTTAYYISPASPSTGWKLTSFLGYRHGLGSDPSRHFRYGVDLQRYLNLFRGDRVLILRTYVEGVTGTLDDVSFVDLPHLGGPLFLRGYTRNRFRDRIVTLATAEYAYPIVHGLGGYLFVDAGRVWRDYEQIGLENIRVGFGGGLQAQSKSAFVARLFVASSIDGGLVFNLSFDPIFDSRSLGEDP